MKSGVANDTQLQYPEGMASSVKRYEIEGADFSSLEGFFREVGRVLLHGQAWGENLDALDEILCGGAFGLESQFEVVWKNAELSQQNLSYAETERQLALRLAACHPLNRPQVSEALQLARLKKGPTVFDWLMDIFAVHRETVSLILA